MTTQADFTLRATLPALSRPGSRSQPWRRRSLCVLVPLVLAFAASAGAQPCPSLIWADEFNGSSVDLTKWTPLEGDGCAQGLCGWGNNELQSYSPNSATVSNGTLRIRAQQTAGGYTSARLSSGWKADFFGGRFEARVKAPVGKGLWAGFWMTPTYDVFGKWPQSGELDIMEYVGQRTSSVFGAVHFGDRPPGNHYLLTRYEGIDGARFSDDYHTFAAEREAGVVRWYVDDVHVETWTPADLAPYTWPFDEAFHMIVSLAVGGMAGAPDSDTTFPQDFWVDYVRVYDGPKPQFSGSRFVESAEKGSVYSLNNAPSGGTITWSVPADARIVSGQGTSSITIDWGLSSGDVVANISSACGTEQLRMQVDVESLYSRQSSLENFDDPPTAIYNEIRTTGTLTPGPNPHPSALNNSVRAGSYLRDGASQFDALFFNTPNLGDASLFVGEQKKLFFDLYTDAPVGTEIAILFHDSSQALTTNWPVGRHSYYRAKTTKRNEWERIEMEYFERPDSSIRNDAVDELLILFAPGSFTGHEYVIDNFDVYGASN